MHRRHVLALACVLAAPLPVLAADAVDAARGAAGEWLQLVDRADYPASWASAATGFKRVVTQENWTEAVLAARGPLGALKQRSEQSAKYAKTIPGAPDGEYVVMQFESSFDRRERAMEALTLVLDTDGRWHVTGYFVK